MLTVLSDTPPKGKQLKNKKKDNLICVERNYRVGPADDPSGKVLAQIAGILLASLCAAAIGFSISALL